MNLEKQILAAQLLRRAQDGVIFLGTTEGEKHKPLTPHQASDPELLQALFDEPSVRVLWFQAEHRCVLPQVLRAGYVPGTPLDKGHPVLVITRRQWAYLAGRIKADPYNQPEGE